MANNIDKRGKLDLGRQIRIRVIFVTAGLSNPFPTSTFSSHDQMARSFEGGGRAARGGGRAARGEGERLVAEEERLVGEE